MACQLRASPRHSTAAGFEVIAAATLAIGRLVLAGLAACPFGPQRAGATLRGDFAPVRRPCQLTFRERRGER
jgi:hypothetical protein